MGFTRSGTINGYLMRFSGINKRQAESIFVSDLVPKISQSMFLFFSDVNLKQDFETQEVSESVKAKQQKLFSALKYLFLSTIHLGRLVEMICANIVGQIFKSSSGPNTWFFGRKKHQHDDIPSIFPLNPAMFSWSNHHQTMVVLSFSKGFVPWFYAFSHGFPMFFLWFSHGFMFFPLVFLCFPMVFLRFNSTQGHHRLRGGAIRPVPRLHGRAGPGWPGVRGSGESWRMHGSMVFINGIYRLI
jgi:hypothetical protein